jgi:hypothetical protein
MRRVVKSFDAALEAYFVRGEQHPLTIATEELRALLPQDLPNPIIASRLAIVDSFCLSLSPIIL